MEDKLTLREALLTLEAYELADSIIFESFDDTKSCYSHDYDDWVEENAAAMRQRVNQEIIEAGSYEAWAAKQNQIKEAAISNKEREPAIGDIAILQVRLNHPTADKLLYCGCERRPVVIIKVNKNSIDGFEITHSSTFNNLPLLNLGKLNSDTDDSYVNIYAACDDLPIEYDFPIEFNSDGTPKSKGEYLLQYFGQVYRGKDAAEPFLIHFDYNSNYKEHLSIDKVVEILFKIKK